MRRTGANAKFFKFSSTLVEKGFLFLCKNVSIDCSYGVDRDFNDSRRSTYMWLMNHAKSSAHGRVCRISLM